MNQLERPHFAIIPYEVRVDSNLKAPHRELYGELIGLSKKFGYLFAEDEQISEMMNIPLRTIQRYLKKLEEAGHIIRRTKNVQWLCEDGKTQWKKKRKIYFKGNFPNDLECEKPCFKKNIAEPPKMAGPLEPPKMADINKRTINKRNTGTSGTASSEAIKDLKPDYPDWLDDRLKLPFLKGSFDEYKEWYQSLSDMAIEDAINDCRWFQDKEEIEDHRSVLVERLNHYKKLYSSKSFNPSKAQRKRKGERDGPREG